MLGWLVWGLAFGGAAAAFIIISVSYLNKAKIREKLRANNVYKAEVKNIVTSSNVTHIKLDGLDEEGNEVEIQIDAKDYNASEIRQGTVIYA